MTTLCPSCQKETYVTEEPRCQECGVLIYNCLDTAKAIGLLLDRIKRLEQPQPPPATE